MQMGMLGNLYVRPAQNGTPYTYGGRTYSAFAYNDGDGSTGYDREVPIQIGSFDSSFHNASESVQPLPFALMRDDYPMLNGRGYPDTVNPAALAPPPENGSKPSQLVSSLITATAGERVLLRISNLNVTRYYTVGTMGLPMQVVGRDAKLLRGPDPDGAGPLAGKDLYYTTSSVTLGGGESVDVIVDTAGTTAGDVYFLYATNLNYLNNKDEEFGGMMTEIRIN
jgi:FtsP/CotA-like multicopper oxidase with cupredoxin domain